MVKSPGLVAATAGAVRFIAPLREPAGIRVHSHERIAVFRWSTSNTRRKTRISIAAPMRSRCARLRGCP